ncbi:MAG: uroporphyrinogen-III synthase [Pseudomonadota bacterium]
MSAQHRVPVILTRAKAQSERFATELPDGTEPVVSPLLEIKVLPLRAGPRPEETLLFTSENGVAALVAHKGGYAGQTALCVGDRTAEAARTAGFAAQSANGSAEDLVELAMRSSGDFAHVRGFHSRGDVAKQLRLAGHTCREIVLYDQLERGLSPEARKILDTKRTCLVPLFSPRTAILFSNAQPAAPAAHMICLSATVAEAVSDGDYASISISNAPKASALLVALRNRLESIRLETRGVSG